MRSLVALLVCSSAVLAVLQLLSSEPKRFKAKKTFRIVNSSMLHNASARYTFRTRPCRWTRRTAISIATRPKSSLTSGIQRYGCSRASATFIPTASRYLTTSTRSAIQSPNAGQYIDIDGDTIYALSTGAGARAGIAIVRISGPACLQIYRALCPEKPPPKARYATVRMLHDPSDNGLILDSSALVLYFPGPKTVTGENVLELHIHGGPATVKAVLSAIPRCSPHTRMAEPGEFTRRAFENGRLDLVQVETLSDTLAAETEQQRRAAVRGTSRKLGRSYDGWREQLVYARGELEALIDFSEDQHFDESPAELLADVIKSVHEIVGTITQHEYASQRGNLLRRGVEIALIGPPNAGKSSLLNLIVGREASIVSSEAGTTRDIVEVRYDIGGYLCTFADTAGLRKASIEGGQTRTDNLAGFDRDSKTSSMFDIVGTIEQEGIKRAKTRAQESDLIILLASIERNESAVGTRWSIEYDEDTLFHILGDVDNPPKPSIIVVNKCDSAPANIKPDLLQGFENHLQEKLPTGTFPAIVGISCLEAITPKNEQDKDPGNIGTLTAQLTKVIASMTDLPAEQEDLIGVTERQRQLLSACKGHLMDFLSETSSDQLSSLEGDMEVDVVLAAEHLRSAADCLSRITGRGLAGDVEEVLGVVFEKFCVGK
ncbi:P-loop containing nucleoside triphosphate hydrolase protein [Mollisia scopiformis]|uniref:p-loop containing nucleoside triphosphate hydrolase protein n=1 Tax=Mollisia scopiformis TaxID=149040 RepID=A0A194WVG2_MOLSC|nr:P-loop containing nucleoside triphosphate hydrolase protein [Mollisia scopiformis]KUJ11659.1 P-loop containing nucleoside triphosphate hydrolase protein [Mollisia scopiformis]